jgi:2-polyprenyl-3-methyl-5-hydroxy-6-metoxy-1,4-benzoquinol methylase
LGSAPARMRAVDSRVIHRATGLQNSLSRHELGIGIDGDRALLRGPSKLSPFKPLEPEPGGVEPGGTRSGRRPALLCFPRAPTRFRSEDATRPPSRRMSRRGRETAGGIWALGETPKQAKRSPGQMRAWTRAKLRNPPYVAREARLAWERSAATWEAFQERGQDFARDLVHGPALLRTLGAIRGLRVLDVGCGQGRFTRELARRGAQVTAIDWSDAMVRRARRHERECPLGIRFRHLDAREIGATWRAGSFDRVVACMSFMDMPGLPRVLRGAHRVLTDRGRLVFSVSHPFNTAAVGWERPGAPARGAMRAADYFVERVGVTEWKMKRLDRPFDTLYWHRTFESWFALLRSGGFRVEMLTEPHATISRARTHQFLRGARAFPFFLTLDCRRLAPSEPRERHRGSSRTRA